MRQFKSRFRSLAMIITAAAATAVPFNMATAQTTPSDSLAQLQTELDAVDNMTDTRGPISPWSRYFEGWAQQVLSQRFQTPTIPDTNWSRPRFLARYKKVSAVERRISGACIPGTMLATPILVVTREPVSEAA